MKTLKKPMSFLLFATMLISVLCAAPFNVFAATTHNVSTVQELSDACDAINQSGGEHTISLKDDISGVVSIEITNSNAVVTVIGNGHTLTSTGSAVAVSNGATVNLGDGNSALTLKDTATIGAPGIVYVKDSGSTCNMYDKVTLKDHIGNNYFGGGVTVEAGTFNMHGGTIQDCGINGGSVCYGGGVAVFAGGEFIMNGGTISNCYAKSDFVFDEEDTSNDGYKRPNDPEHCFTAQGGGVFVTGGSTFIMNGGNISGCTATNMGGGVALSMSQGEKVAASDQYGYIKSSVIINDGTISGNSANMGAGVFASGYFYSSARAIATATPGIGTSTNPGLYINGGEISSNNATNRGGGVLIVMLRADRIAQIHNAEIKSNTANSGAGIENMGFWTQLDIDGCTISNNTATAKGGGLLALSNSAEGYTSIKDTTITNNTSGERGAGVYYDADSEIRISGADVIQGNKYNGKKNNLNILSLDKPVKVVGDLTGSQIGLSDPTLWDDGKADTAEDAISTARLTDGFKAENASLIPSNAFTSDHESWYVDFGEKKTEQGAETGRTYKYKASLYPTTNYTDASAGYELKSGPNNEPYIDFDTTEFSDFRTPASDVYNAIHAKYIEDGYKDKGARDFNAYGKKWRDSNLYYDENNGIYIDVVFASYWNLYIFTATSEDSATEYASEHISEIICGGSYQNLNGSKPGKVVLYTISYDNNVSYNGSPSATNIPLEYSEQLNFGSGTTKAIPQINDIGLVTGKYVVDKSSEECDIQYETITTDYTSEVRLVRKVYDVNYHINNADMSDIYADEIFTPYITNHEVKDGKTIEEFHNIPQLKDPDGYVFKGWYYDKDNTNDKHPVVFGETYDSQDIYKGYHKNIDIYAHWEKVDKIEQENDGKDLPNEMKGEGGKYYYDSFGLFGVQLRPDRWIDENTGVKENGGLRFATSISEKLLEDINRLSTKKVVSEQGYEHNVEYGFVTASKDITDTIVNEPSFNINKATYKLQYKGTDVNGVDTTVNERSENNFNYVTNVDCTSQQGGYGGNDAINIDHRNCIAYRIATYVVTYKDNPQNMGKNVIARAYLRYYDANGLLRTFYNDYDGTTVYGGCCTSYNAAAEMLSKDPIKYNNQITN